jgi:hypothetical protein
MGFVDREEREIDQSFRLRLHSGLRQSGNAFGVAFMARLKPCPSELQISILPRRG